MIFKLDLQGIEPESELPKPSIDEAPSPNHDTASVEHESTAIHPDDLEPLLLKQCKVWQRRLRLSDWHVTVKLCRLREMGDKCVGSIRSFLESKDATMYLLSPIDLPLICSDEYLEESSNYDLTIVHELLHLHFAPFQSDDDESPAGIAQEQAVNCISQALINAYTKKHTQSPMLSETTRVGHYL